MSNPGQNLSKMGRNLSKMGRNLCGTKSVKNGTKSVKNGTKSVWDEICQNSTWDEICLGRNLPHSSVMLYYLNRPLIDNVLLVSSIECIFKKSAPICPIALNPIYLNAQNPPLSFLGCVKLRTHQKYFKVSRILFGMFLVGAFSLKEKSPTLTVSSFFLFFSVDNLTLSGPLFLQFVHLSYLFIFHLRPSQRAWVRFSH